MKLTDVAVHTGLASATIETLTGSTGLTVIVTGVEVAGLPDGQVAFEVRMQVTTSLLTGVYEKPVLFVPVLLPFTCHWYAGADPPLTGVAVKVAGLPWHTGLISAAMDTLTG